VIATTNCDNDYKWMNLTREEKVAQLDIHYCSGDLEVHPEIHAFLEDLTNSNDSNHMSCEEFNKAHDLEGLWSRGKMYKIPMCFVLLLTRRKPARANKKTRVNQARQPRSKERMISFDLEVQKLPNAQYIFIIPLRVGEFVLCKMY
jgi:hypothetical protein